MEDNKKMEFEDVYSDSKKKPTYKKGHKPLEEREIYYPNKFIKFLFKNNRRNTKILLVIMIILLLLAAGAGVYMLYSGMFDQTISEEEGWQGSEELVEDYDENQFAAMHEVSDAASLDDLLEKWYSNNGSIMDQEYVTNILLLGIDGENGVKKGGNSDSMILVSVNDKTKQITMVSFMRDSRTYFEVNGRDYWTKANAAFARGGARATVKMIENNYKVDIDYFVAVDFTTFSDLVDALGGVTLEIEEYEQKYINRTTKKINKIPNYGTVTLDGDQALVYCRIRKSDADSDVSRTRRQRNFVSSLIRSAKGATLNQLTGAVNAVLPHLSTDCSKNKVLGYAGQALTKGWMNYEIVQLTMPDEETRKDATFNGVSYWVVDYPLAAQKVQMAIYGTSNIQLDADRESALDYVRYNNSSGSSSSSGNSSNGNSSNSSNSSNEGYSNVTNDNSGYNDNEYTTDEYRTSYDDNSGDEKEETTTRRGVNFPWDGLLTTAPDDEVTTDKDKEPLEKTTAAKSDEDPEEEVTTAKQSGEDSDSEAA